MAQKKDRNPHAVALGQLGARIRSQKLTPEKRREIAQKAIRARSGEREKEKQHSDYSWFHK
jgi:hypothetical protein